MTPRCSITAEGRGDLLRGTASTVTRFLLLEVPGPWGVDALDSTRLPSGLGRELASRAGRHRVRVLFIRRHGRTREQPRRCFAVSADPVQPWVETTVLDDLRDVRNLDLAALASGATLGLPRHDGRLLLVCTHGRHDPCCAERGRPLATALAASHPEQTWECSHVGGDRFAGNLVVLPDGFYYGRVEAGDGPRIAQLHDAGELDLPRLRGRVSSSFPAQAAEWQLRTRLGHTAIGDVRLVREDTEDGRTAAVFEVADGDRWLVRMRTTRGPAAQLNCRATRASPVPSYELESIETDAARC